MWFLWNVVGQSLRNHNKSDFCDLLRPHVTLSLDLPTHKIDRFMPRREFGVHRHFLYTHNNVETYGLLLGLVLFQETSSPDLIKTIWMQWMQATNTVLMMHTSNMNTTMKNKLCSHTAYAVLTHSIPQPGWYLYNVPEASERDIIGLCPLLRNFVYFPVGLVYSEGYCGIKSENPVTHNLSQNGYNWLTFMKSGRWLYEKC